MTQKKNNPRHSSGLSLKMPLFLMAVIISVSLFYIFNITANSTNGFKISELEDKINNLKLVNQDLKNKINLLDNPALLKDKAESAGLVVSGQVEYLNVKDGEVAINK
ncbi:MAG TPA: hypothetical protein PLK76_04375 [bacterium]|nr:hypothetical protein [bacterium]